MSAMPLASRASTINPATPSSGATQFVSISFASQESPTKKTASATTLAASKPNPCSSQATRPSPSRRGKTPPAAKPSSAPHRNCRLVQQNLNLVELRADTKLTFITSTQTTAKQNIASMSEIN